MSCDAESSESQSENPTYSKSTDTTRMKKEEPEVENIVRLTQENLKMNTFRRNRRYVDAVMVCNEKRLSAHRLVVACCSPFLADLLEKDSRIHSMTTLEVEYVDEETMDHLLTFMYRGAIFQADKLDNGKLLQIVMAGHYFQVRGAAAYFSELLLQRDNGRLEHACQLWEWADKLVVPEVISEVVAYVTYHVENLMFKNEHVRLRVNCLEEVLKKLIASNPQVDLKKIFLSICLWIEHDVRSRDEHFERLTSILDKNTLPWTTIFQILTKTSLLTTSTRIRQLMKTTLEKSLPQDSGDRETIHVRAAFEHESIHERAAVDHESIHERATVDRESIHEKTAVDSGTRARSQTIKATSSKLTTQKIRRRHRSPTLSIHRRHPLPRRSRSALLPSDPSSSDGSSCLQQMISGRSNPVLFLLSSSSSNKLIVHCCRLDNYQWSAAYSLGLPAYKDMGITYHNSTLYLVGGEDASSQTKLSMIYAFDVDTQNLHSGPHLRSPRSCTGIAAQGQLIYLLGGKNRWNKALDIAEIFHPGEGWFANLPRMTSRRYRPNVGILQNRLYVIGGNTRKCEMLDLRRPSVSWDTIESIPEDFTSINTIIAAMENALVIVRCDKPTRMCMYNPIRNSWRTRRVEGECPGTLVNAVPRRGSNGGFWSVDEDGKIFTFDVKLNKWQMEMKVPEDAKHPMYLAVEDFVDIGYSKSSMIAFSE